MLANIRRAFQLVNVPTRGGAWHTPSEIGIPFEEMCRRRARLPIPLFAFQRYNSSSRIYCRVLSGFRRHSALSKRRSLHVYSLADRIKQDENEGVNRTERLLRWAAIIVLSVILFGGLFLGVKFLE